MKRTFSGSRAQKAADAPNVPPNNWMRSLPSKLEASSIPSEARKHIEYLSQFHPSQICQWVEIWQRSKAQEIDGTDSVSCCLHHKCSDLLEAESDTLADRIVGQCSVKSEQPPINLPITLGDESVGSKFEVAECSDRSFQKCITSARVVRNSLRKNTLVIYACSFCDKAFSRKGDWKRHEGSLHEPQKQWCCLESGCNRKFTAGNKFRQHHQSDHGCENCNHDADVAVISIIQTTSAWGCGFCATLLMTWDDRANHIGHHFETGSTRSDWDFSRVIQGLLRQPKVFDAWQSLLLRIHGSSRDKWPRFKWPVEYSRELLRSLQGANHEQSATNIAQLAYNLSLRAESENELNTPSLYKGLCLFLEPATAKEFLVDPFESGDSLPTPPKTYISGNEACQPGQPLITPSTVTLDDGEAYEALLGNSHVVEEYFQNHQDYTTPCAETFEPTAWFLWPDPSPLMD